MTSPLFLSLSLLTGPNLLFSIRLDEYYDVDDIPLEGLHTDGFPCLHIKSKCYVSDECCGPATCVLPAWSPTPVCLVPGYKEDDRLERMSARDPPRREDILYIRNTYNTTFYDFLLSDFTSPSPQLGSVGVDSSVYASTENLTMADDIDDKSYHFASDGSESYLTIGNKTALPQLMNVTSVENDFENSIEFQASSEPHSFLKGIWETTSNSHLEQDLGENPSGLNKSVQELNLKITKHHSFLLLNSTIKTVHGNSITNLREIYDNLKSSDQFKVVVQLLQEKLRQLNEKQLEKELLSNISKQNDQKLLLPTETPTTPPTTTPKSAKWEIVKRFFLNKPKTSNQLKITDKVKNSMTPKEFSTKLKTTIGHEKIADGDISSATETPSREKLDSNEEMRKFIDTFIGSKKVGEIQKHNQNVIPVVDPQSSNDEDVLEYYNIDIPYDLDETNDSEAIKGKNSLEKTFSALAKSINSLKSKTFENHDKGRRKVKENKAAVFNNNTTQSTDNLLNATTEKTLNMEKKVHLWQKAYLWPINQNISAVLAKKVKNLFGIKINSISCGKNKLNYTPLNEHFLLTLNSKNFSEKLPDSLPQSDQSEKTSDYSLHYSSSVESTSSDYEDLYNNSYVFKMPKKNKTDVKEQTKLSRILSFFHITRVIPKKKNPCSDPLSGSCKITKLKSGRLAEETLQNLTAIVAKNVSETIVVQDIIRLPEKLLPEALEVRQLNNPDLLLFTDSKEVEDKTIEKHGSSNSTFFFFFRQ